MTSKRAVVAALLGLGLMCLALPGFAKNAKTVTKGPIVINEFKHDTGPLLREIAPMLPAYQWLREHIADSV